MRSPKRERPADATAVGGRGAIGLIVLVAALSPLGGCATDYCGDPDPSPQPDLTEATVVAIDAPLVIFSLDDATQIEVDVRGDLDPLAIGETYLVPFYGLEQPEEDEGGEDPGADDGGAVDDATSAETTSSTGPPLLADETTSTVAGTAAPEIGEIALSDITAYMPDHDCSGGAIRHVDGTPLDIGSPPFSGFEKASLTIGVLGGAVIIVWGVIRRVRGEFL